MKVIITGTTGMVGKGVLLECIDNSSVKEILMFRENGLLITFEELIWGFLRNCKLISYCIKDIQIIDKIH